MKELSNYQRVANYLVKIFKAVNEEYFNNELEMPTITVQSSVGAYGHISTSRIWTNNGIPTYELNVGAETLTRPIENLVATIIHEASHLYALMHGIKDTSNQGVYHNKRFKKIAEEMGHLEISRHNQYGWTVTHPTEDTIDFCITRGFEDILINRNSCYRFHGISTGDDDSSNVITRVKKPSSTRKYICPCCGAKLRTTKDLNVLCMECNEQFEKIEY